MPGLAVPLRCLVLCSIPFVLCMRKVAARRSSRVEPVAATHKSLNAESESVMQVKAQVDLAAGAWFQGRFLLEEQMWSIGQSRDRSQKTQTNDLDELPDNVKDNVDPDSVKYLFAGSFGQVWKAKDLNGKVVVLKVFYHGDQFLTWERALDDQNHFMQKELAAAANECEIAMQMQMYAATDKGAQRLMRCFEDHVTRGTSKTNHKVSDTDVLYQVLEYCGDQNLEQWFSSELEKADLDVEDYYEQLRSFVKQVVEGLNYMTSHNKKWVHHDLKPANVVLKRQPNCPECGIVVKLVDFGAVTEVTAANAVKSIPTTRTIAAPEAYQVAKVLSAEENVELGSGYSYLHPSSFDVYSVAASFAEMITGGDDLENKFRRAGAAHLDSLPWKVRSAAMKRKKAVEQQCMRAKFLLGSVKPDVTEEEYQEALQQPSLDSLLKKYRKQMRELEEGVTKLNDAKRVLRFGFCGTLMRLWEKKDREYQVTGEFGLPDLDSWRTKGAELWQAKVANILLDVPDRDREESMQHHVNAKKMAVYAMSRSQDEGSDSSWADVLMRMLAYNPEVRPLPAEVLSSVLLHDVPYTPDPDFAPKK